MNAVVIDPFEGCTHLDRILSIIRVEFGRHLEVQRTDCSSLEKTVDVRNRERGEVRERAS